VPLLDFANETVPFMRAFNTPASDNVLTGTSNRYCIVIPPGTAEIKATLTWTDPPSSPMSGHILVNYLDLVMIDTSGVEYRTDTTTDGQFDRLNNVEQIFLSNPTPGAYAVHVYGYYVAGTVAQTYALVISGNFEYDSVQCDGDFDNSTNRICPNGCSGRGTCNSADGTCTCNTGYVGLDCSLTPCPVVSGTECNGLGSCNGFTGQCECTLGYAPPDCSSLAVTNSTTQNIIIQQKSSHNGVPQSTFIGVVIGAFIIGCIFSVFIGGFIAVKYLEHKRDTLQKQRETADEVVNQYEMK